jgi:hypothetical protein
MTQFRPLSGSEARPENRRLFISLCNRVRSITRATRG